MAVKKGYVNRTLVLALWVVLLTSVMSHALTNVKRNLRKDFVIKQHAYWTVIQMTVKVSFAKHSHYYFCHMVIASKYLIVSGGANISLIVGVTIGGMVLLLTIVGIAVLVIAKRR